MQKGDARLGTHLAARLVAPAVIAIVLVAVIFGVYLPRASTTSEKPSSSASATSTSTGSSGVTSQSSSPSTTSSTSTGQYYTTTSPGPAPCTQPYKLPASNTTTFANGTSVFAYAEPVFVVPAGSTMDVCVLFLDYTHDGINLNYSSPPVLNATEWRGYTAVITPGVVNDTLIVPAINVTVTPSPGSFSLDTNQSIVVEYQISTGENSTGFDGLGPSAALSWNLGVVACIQIPLAVGYSPSQVNNSGFPPYPGLNECPDSPLTGFIIGYTGGSVVYLTEENRG
jgi:hypothetical protein